MDIRSWVRGVHVRLPGHDHPAVPPPLPLQRLRGLPALPGQQLSHLPRSLQGSTPGTLLPLTSELRIRFVYPWFRIQDPIFFHPGSRVKKISYPGSGSAAKKLSILCSSRDPDLYFFIHPGSRGQKDTGSRNPGQQLSHLPRSLQGSSPGTTSFYSRIQDPNFFNPGTQANNCPICCAPFRALLQVPPLTTTSVAGPGCLSRIQDSIFFPSRITDPDPKQKVFLTQKTVSKLAEMWCGMFMPDPDPGSRSWFFTHPGSQIQGSKRHRIPGQPKQKRI